MDQRKEIPPNSKRVWRDFAFRHDKSAHPNHRFFIRWACLLRGGGAHRRSGVLPDETLRQYQPRRHGHDRPHAAPVLPRHVREGRPAAGGGGPALHSGEIHPPENPSLCDKQLLSLEKRIGNRKELW